MFSLLSLDSHTPAVGTTTFDLVPLLYEDFQIPVWVSLSFWLESEDALAIAEGFGMSVSYLDPSGNTRTIDGTPFSLGIAGGFTVVPVTPIQRQSATSAVDVIMNRSGAGAGAPLVAARVMTTRLCLDNLGANAIWTP